VEKSMEENNENKLFVGNLAWGVTSEELGEFFSQAGEVASANVITDRQTGRSRGFGFVEMASADLAQKAVDELNDKEIQGRKIVVNIAKPKAPRNDA
jgi:RNA recognition motif-containing protein